VHRLAVEADKYDSIVFKHRDDTSQCTHEI